MWHWHYIRERAHSSEARRSEKSSSTSLINKDATYAPLPDDTVPSYLEARGYPAANLLTWAITGPAEWEPRTPPHVSGSARAMAVLGWAHGDGWCGLADLLVAPTAAFAMHCLKGSQAFAQHFGWARGAAL